MHARNALHGTATMHKPIVYCDLALGDRFGSPTLFQPNFTWFISFPRARAALLIFRNLFFFLTLSSRSMTHIPTVFERGTKEFRPVLIPNIAVELNVLKWLGHKLYLGIAVLKPQNKFLLTKFFAWLHDDVVKQRPQQALQCSGTPHFPFFYLFHYAVD